MKYLRDLTPLYPELRSWMANKLKTWRKVQLDVGLGREIRISNFQLNTVFDT